MNKLENASTPEMLKFKVACKSEDFSDAQIESIFLNFHISSEQEIKEIIDILHRFRPKVLKHFNAQIKNKSYDENN